MTQLYCWPQFLKTLQTIKKIEFDGKNLQFKTSNEL